MQYELTDEQIENLEGWQKDANLYADYAEALIRHIDTFKALRKEGIFFYSVNPYKEQIYSPLMRMEGTLLLYERLSGKMVMNLEFSWETKDEAR